jgi:hypothetical protein
MVRASAAYSIGKVLPSNVLELLQSAFFEESQIIRNSAIMGMRGSNRVNLQLLKSIVGGKIPEKVKDALTPLLIYADTSIQAKEIAQLISNTPIHRAHIVIDGLLNEANGALSERVKEILRKVLDIQIDTTIKEKIRKNGQIQLIQESNSRKK